MVMATVNVDGTELQVGNLPRMLYPHQIEKNETNLTLREVEEDSTYFKGLVGSIQTPRRDESGKIVSDHGLLNPIVVRPLPGQAGKYAIVDGLHRLTAWKTAFGDSKPIPCAILELTEIGVVKAQIQANAFQKKTRVAEFGRAMSKYMQAFPQVTVEELAKDFSFEPGTIRNFLALSKLPIDLQESIDNGELPASVGYQLAKFTEAKVNKDPVAKAFWDEARHDWISRYNKLKDEEAGLVRWISETASALKDLKKQRRDDPNRKSPKHGIIIEPVMRKKDVLLTELDRVNMEVETSPYNEEKLKEGDKAMLEAAYQRGYRFGLQFALQMDPDTYNKRYNEKKEDQEARERAKSEKVAGAKSETIARSTNIFSA